MPQYRFNSKTDFYFIESKDKNLQYCKLYLLKYKYNIEYILLITGLENILFNIFLNWSIERKFSK